MEFVDLLVLPFSSAVGVGRAFIVDSDPRSDATTLLSAGGHRTMGTLNSLIKFLVLNANALISAGGLGAIILASVVLSSDFIKLNKVLWSCDRPATRPLLCGYGSRALM